MIRLVISLDCLGWYDSFFFDREAFGKGGKRFVFEGMRDKSVVWSGLVLRRHGLRWHGLR